MAEAEGRIRKEGRPTKELAQSARVITDPRKHFGAMFGVGEKYVEMAAHDLAVQLAARFPAIAETVDRLNFLIRGWHPRVGTAALAGVGTVHSTSRGCQYD
jgi:hypothetical protein